MERLTERIKRLQKDELIVYTNGKYEDTIPAEMTNDDIRSVLKKLAAYEDLEEHGLLVKLPCKVGDTVYKITRFCSGGIRDCGYSYECSECPEYKPFIEYIEFKITILKDIGKTVFLTREEAEKKLEEMKK